MEYRKNMGQTSFHGMSGMHVSMSCPNNLQGNKNTGGTWDLWTDGLLCAYEFIPSMDKKYKVGGKFGEKSGPVQGKFDAEFSVQPQELAASLLQANDLELGGNARGDGGDQKTPGTRNGDHQMDHQDSRSERKDDSLAGASPLDRETSNNNPGRKELGSHWNPIGWERLAELVQTVEVNAEWPADDTASEDDGQLSVADLAAPYWQRRAGPTFWCHVDARHPYILSWLAHAQWLHPAISGALRDENRLISDRMKHLFYEVPVRVGGGLLFELLGQTVGDPRLEEEDVPVVLRSWQAKNFLITSMHVKGMVQNLNVLGVLEVQDLVGAGGAEAPKSAHEVISQLANRLARWDDRLYRKHYFGAADEVELKFVNRRPKEDLNLLSIILNQEIRRLSTQVIRVKWSLHAREEILYELLTHLRGKASQKILETVCQNTREMIEEQEAVRDRIFTVQDVMQNSVRAWLQDKSVRIQHNLAVIGGCGLLLSVIVGLFGINVDGIPGAAHAPYAFASFSFLLVLLGAVTIGLGIRFLGMKPPPSEEEVTSRKVELQEFVKTFQRQAEAHEKVQNSSSSNSLSEEDVSNNRAEGYILMP